MQSMEANFYAGWTDDSMNDLWCRFVLPATAQTHTGTHHVHLLDVYMANYDLFEQSFFSTASAKCASKYSYIEGNGSRQHPSHSS